MKTRILGFALAAAVGPATLSAQAPATDTLARVTALSMEAPAPRMTVRLTGGHFVLPFALPDARLALPDSAAALDLLPALPTVNRQWVRTGKWSLLAVAAGFSAYAMMHSGGEGPDRRAQLGIAGGHLALLGSAGLFIYDLRHSRREPENIPFEADAGVRGER